MSNLLKEVEKELNIPKEKLIEEGLKHFLEIELSNLSIEIKKLGQKYGVDSFGSLWKKLEAGEITEAECFDDLSKLENLEMGAYTVASSWLLDIKEQKTKNQKLKTQLEKVYNLFPVLKERQKQKAGTLSSGEQQMLAIGRALMLKPKMLLLDEPSLGLSPNYMDTVFERLKEININGTTILIVEQNARMVLEHADQGYVFEIGKIVFEDKAKNLLENDEVKKSFLGG